MGYELQKGGHYDEALSRLNEAAKVDPKHQETFYCRARTYVQKGKLDQAQSDLEEAIRLDPHHFEAYETLNWVFGKGSRWEEMIALWSRFLELEPNNANAYFGRAGAFHHKGDQVAAFTDLKKACDLGNGNACQIYDREHGRAGAAR